MYERHSTSDHIKNTHSIQKKQIPYSLQQSQTNTSSSRPRRLSCATIQMPYIDKLMSDIKITPNKPQKVRNQQILQIQKILATFSENNTIHDQIQTIKLMLHSIQTKLNYGDILRKQVYSSIKKKQHSQVSPIKQLSVDNSQILYTNFSLKQLQENINNNVHTPVKNLNENKAQLSNSSIKIQNKLQCYKLQNLSKKGKVSFVNYGLDEIQDQNKVAALNNQITMLENLLKQKTQGKLQKKQGNKKNAESISTNSGNTSNVNSNKGIHGPLLCQYNEMCKLKQKKFQPEKQYKHPKAVIKNKIY